MRSLRWQGVLLVVLGTTAVMTTEGCARRIHSAPPVHPATSRPPAAFSATAYCSGGTTASGATVKPGMVAADPKFLPIGSVIAVSGLDKRHNGVYTVTDTGPKIRGHRLDIYMSDCHEARRFGRRRVQVRLL
jgi:3D (Asp-Asp-Asp) domain-containing protein